MTQTSRPLLIAAFASVYLIWGSTYLAIRFAIETLPPFLMAAARFITAGAILFAWTRLKGTPLPTGQQWRTSAVIGALLLVGGNGAVVWAEQYVPSGITALLIASEPLWIVIFSAVLLRNLKLDARIVFGLIAGLAGVTLLVSPTDIDHAIHPVGALVVIGAAISWATGSLYSKYASLPSSPLLATSCQMLTGGALLALAGVLNGELAGLGTMQVSLRSVLALAYLTIFGSIVAFTAYVWVLRAASPAKASTYAFVNPIIAVFLGWALGDEAVTSQTLIAAALIVMAVTAIISHQSAEGSTLSRSLLKSKRARKQQQCMQANLALDS